MLVIAVPKLSGLSDGLKDAGGNMSGIVAYTVWSDCCIILVYCEENTDLHYTLPLTRRIGVETGETDCLNSPMQRFTSPITSPESSEAFLLQNRGYKLPRGRNRPVYVYSGVSPILGAFQRIRKTCCRLPPHHTPGVSTARYSRC